MLAFSLLLALIISPALFASDLRTFNPDSDLPTYVAVDRTFKSDLRFDIEDLTLESLMAEGRNKYASQEDALRACKNSLIAALEAYAELTMSLQELENTLAQSNAEAALKRSCKQHLLMIKRQQKTIFMAANAAEFKECAMGGLISATASLLYHVNKK